MASREEVIDVSETDAATDGTDVPTAAGPAVDGEHAASSSPQGPGSDPMDEQTPLPMRVAWGAVARSMTVALQLLLRHRVHLSHGRLGLRVRFADGSSSTVYRETVVSRPPPVQPCVLVVRFRLRLVGGFGHRLFRAESLLNTPLFIGFPGFVSKLWLAHDENRTYRGLYQWDGPADARAYARSLWRILALVSEPGSIGYRVLPGLERDDLLGRSNDPITAARPEPAGWWRPVGTVSAGRGAR